MADTSQNLTGIGAGLARGLAAVYGQKRQQDQQATLAREGRQSALMGEAFQHLLTTGRFKSPDDIIPFAESMLGTGGATGTSGKRGKAKAGEVDPTALLMQVLGPALSAGGTTTPGAGPGASEGPPSALAPTGGVPPAEVSSAASGVAPAPVVAAPGPAATAPGSMFYSDAEMTDKAVGQAGKVRTAERTADQDALMNLATRLRGLDPTMSVEDSLIAVGLKVPKDQFGTVPTGGGVFNKATGEITEPPSARVPKLTGQLGERMRTLLAQANLDEATATPEQVADARKRAADMLLEEATETSAAKEANLSSIAANRELRNTLLRMQQAQGGLTPSQVATESRAMRTEWDKAVAPFKERQTYVAKLDEGIKQLQEKKPGYRNSATQTIINSFNRILEEGNAVREGEYARSEELAPLMSQVQGWITSITDGGGKMTDQDLMALAQQGRTVANAVGEVYGAGLADRRQAIEETLQQYKIPSSRVFGNSQIGLRGASDDSAARRTRARQAIVAAGREASDATIDLFLKNNPGFK